MATIRVSLKGGPGYDAPLLTVEGSSAKEVGTELRSLAHEGAFGDVKELAQIFALAKIGEAAAAAEAAAVETVRQSFPRAEVVSEGKYDPTGPVDQTPPACETCGLRTHFESGNNSRGQWSAYKCDSGDPSHTKFL